MLTYADEFIEKARAPDTTAVIVGRDKAREMADEIERLRHVNTMQSAILAEAGIVVQENRHGWTWNSLPDKICGVVPAVNVTTLTIDIDTSVTRAVMDPPAAMSGDERQARWWRRQEKATAP